MIKQKNHFSTSEVAKLMGISRVAVLKKVTTGRIKAEKVGKTYVISRPELEAALGKRVTDEEKEEIKNVVKKAVQEYGVTFEKLGRE